MSSAAVVIGTLRFKGKNLFLEEQIISFISLP